MGSKLKEDERNERTIRALLKQSENRRCINCGSLGPQYVCTTFSIFVCTNCSGLHREFTHRIKSVSMAKFTAEEVRNLQAGGNERARDIFLKEFDLQRNSLPDSSNAGKLRDFIKSVYVERRYVGDRPSPKGRQGDRDDSYESRRPEHRSEGRSQVRSPPFEDRHDDRRFVERRGSDVDRGRCIDRVVRFEEKRSPGGFEPDRSRYGLKGKYEEGRQEDKNFSDERERDRRPSYDNGYAKEIRQDRRTSADERLNTKDVDDDSPTVRPVTEILGNNVPQLWVEENHQTNRGEDAEWLAHGSAAERSRDKQTPVLGSLGTANGSKSVPSSVAMKRVNSGSLIDFTTEPEPFGTAVSTTDPFQVPAVVVTPSAAASTTRSTGWATFDVIPTLTTSTPSPQKPPPGYPEIFVPVPDGHEWAAIPWPSTHAPSTTTMDKWSSLVDTSVQPPLMSLAPHPELVQESKSPTAIRVQPRVDRSRELPKEFFAHSSSSMGMPASGLDMGEQTPDFALATQPFGLGALPTFAQPPRSRNPFDLPGDVDPSAGLSNVVI